MSKDDWMSTREMERMADRLARKCRWSLAVKNRTLLHLLHESPTLYYMVKARLEKPAEKKKYRKHRALVAAIWAVVALILLSLLLLA